MAQSFQTVKPRSKQDINELTLHLGGYQLITSHSRWFEEVNRLVLIG